MSPVLWGWLQILHYVARTVRLTLPVLHFYVETLSHLCFGFSTCTIRLVRLCTSNSPLLRLDYFTFTLQILQTLSPLPFKFSTFTVRLCRPCCEADFNVARTVRLTLPVLHFYVETLSHLPFGVCTGTIRLVRLCPSNSPLLRLDYFTFTLQSLHFCG